MKVRESGMPEQKMWEKFFDLRKILVTLGIDKQTTDVAEFGCGYGTFTIPAAKIIRGKIYACGTCIKSREQEGSEMCPISTIKDMYEIVKEGDKVVTF